MGLYLTHHQCHIRYIILLGANELNGTIPSALGQYEGWPYLTSLDLGTTTTTKVKHVCMFGRFLIFDLLYLLVPFSQLATNSLEQFQRPWEDCRILSFWIFVRDIGIRSLLFMVAAVFIIAELTNSIVFQTTSDLNQLTGSIPTALGRLTSLTSLDLRKMTMSCWLLQFTLSF